MGLQYFVVGLFRHMVGVKGNQGNGFGFRVQGVLRGWYWQLLTNSKYAQPFRADHLDGGRVLIWKKGSRRGSYRMHTITLT